MFINLATPIMLTVLPYALLGFLAMVEGPIATLMGGAATSSGLMQPLPVFFSVVIGNLAADMGWYTLGRFSKLEWITALAPRIGFNPARITQMEKGIQNHAPRLLFLAKLTVGFPIPTIIATGLSRVPIRRWVGMLILGELLKSAVLVSAGYFYAQTLQKASQTVQVVLWVITALVFATGAIWFKRHKKKQETAETTLPGL